MKSLDNRPLVILRGAELGKWIIALVAAALTEYLNFQPGPSHDAVILARPLLISIGIIFIGALLRIGVAAVLDILKKYVILLFLSLFVSIPYFIWYFLGQQEYGPMVMIVGIINVDIVTILQVLVILAISFLLKKLLVLKIGVN